MHTLQGNVFFTASNDMDFREHSSVIRLGNCFLFSRGGSISSDTYYNGFSIDKWLAHTTISRLFLKIRCSGRFKVRIGIHKIGIEHYFINEFIVDGDSCSDLIDISDLSGVLFFNIESIDNDGEFFGFDWCTDDEPNRVVHLALVMTHFNRKEYALPAIEKIQTNITNENIKLFIVDNSKCITPEEANGANVIYNENFGGAGGFTRGLIEAKQQGFTHVLFMDDDASCEPESILRTYQILRYSKNDNLAVAGALLRDVEPYRMFEKGAVFDGFCKPLKSGLDVRDIHSLLISEMDDIKPNYGGWWFFAFPLSAVDHLAFPFFVRGDDLMFSMVNKFELMTMNGISSWAEDFGLKSGPLPTYLDTRNHLVQMLTHLNSDMNRIVHVMRTYMYNNLYSYNYASAKAVIKAVEDVMKGKQFWIDNLDTGSIRKEVASFEPSEKLIPISRSEHDFDYGKTNHSRMTSFIRKITLNGMLLPKFLLKHKVVFQHKSFHANFDETFRYTKIIYEYEPNNVGYVACYSSKDFLKLSLRFEALVLRLKFNEKKLREEYQEAFIELTKNDFWKKSLKIGDE